MAKRDRHAGPETQWATGRDLTDGTTAFEFDNFRRTLEEETSTLRGFRRRVRTDRELSIFPLIVGVPIVLLQAIFAISAVAAGDEPGSPAASAWLAAGIVLVAISMVSKETSIRREFRIYRNGGWIAFQAPTGLVEMSTDGASVLVYDHRAIGGEQRYRSMDLGDPVVLVSTARQPLAAFAEALAAVRRGVTAQLYGRDDLERLRRQFGEFKAVPSDGWFGGTAGTLVGKGTSGYFVAAIPRDWKGGRRTRLGRIVLRGDEASRFSGAIATPTPARGQAAEAVPAPGPLVNTPAAAASTAAKSKRTKKQFVLLIVAMMVVGPAMIAIGTALTAQEDILRSTGTRVEGTVSDVDDGSRASDQRFRVDYVSDDSADHFTWVSWSSDTKPSVGDSETVIYDPSDPGRALVAGYDGDAISIAGLGLIFTVLFWGIGAAGLFGSRKRRAQARADAGPGEA